MLVHLVNFVFPALAVGLLVAALAPLLMKRARPARSWLAQGVRNALACLVVLLAGLWYFGHDGKMASYAAMVLACASSQWLAARAWRG